MDHLIGGFDGLLPYAKEIERCGTSGQMFKTLAYCNQRYINSLKLVKNRLEDPEPMNETEEDPPENESEEFQDTYEEESEWEDPEPERKSGKNRQAKTAGKERKRRGIFK